jgi:hypothetical protein
MILTPTYWQQYHDPGHNKAPFASCDVLCDKGHDEAGRRNQIVVKRIEAETIIWGETSYLIAATIMNQDKLNDIKAARVARQGRTL